MRTRSFVVAAALAAVGLSAIAQTRMESAASPFTYEALGATPSLSLGDKRRANVAEAAAAGRASKASSARATRAAPVGAFTYETLGATPRVEPGKPVAAEAHAPHGAAR